MNPIVEDFLKNGQEIERIRLQCKIRPHCIEIARTCAAISRLHQVNLEEPINQDNTKKHYGRRPDEDPREWAEAHQ